MTQFNLQPPFENLNAAKQRLLIAVPISLLLILLLLYFAFNSIRQGLLIYSAIPLSAIGGILFLALRGMPFSISAGVGFIALFGVAVLNGIVLIAEFNRLKQDGMTDLRHIVITGTKIRLRPVLMTAFVASLGFFPMAISNGAGAEVQRPLATVVIGGLLIATLLTLFVLPILYMTFEKNFSRRNTVSKSLVIVILSCLITSNSANAQTPVKYADAVELALKNNLSIKNEQLKNRYQELLIKTGAVLPQANAFAEFGQINSIYNDSKFGLSQSFNFPTVYIKQKALLREEWRSGLLNTAVKESMLKKQLAQVFYQILYVEKKKQLLLFTDSLYADFSKKSTLRFSSGEANLLEKASAETQSGQIGIQLQGLREDSAILQLQFQLLLNTTSTLVPESGDYKIQLASLPDPSFADHHPYVEWTRQQLQIADATIKLEKSKLLPDLSLAYNNTSIQGIGADDKLYSSSRRFNSVQAMVGIPLLSWTQRSRINSARFSRQIAAGNTEAAIQALSIEYKTAYLQYTKYLQAVKKYELQYIPNADTITTVANQQLANGNINYLEWVQLINQATSVRNDYIEAVRNLNEATIMLNYLTNN